VSPEEIARLAAKYEALGELRRDRARGEPLPPKRVFLDLAREFPGALLELDRLPLDEIDRRREALVLAAAAGTFEPWMAWLDGWHRLMRAALSVKLRLRGERDPTAEQAEALAAAVGAGLDAAFVRAVARPPRGRLTPLVLERLASAFRVEIGTLEAAIFPPRQRPRAGPRG
jgi:hypothetical protein